MMYRKGRIARKRREQGGEEGGRKEKYLALREWKVGKQIAQKETEGSDQCSGKSYS